MHLSRRRNNVGAGKGKKSCFFLGSHYREQRKFGNTKSFKENTRKLEGRELVGSVRVKSFLSMLFIHFLDNRYTLHPTKKNTNRVEHLFRVKSRSPQMVAIKAQMYDYK